MKLLRSLVPLLTILSILLIPGVLLAQVVTSTMTGTSSVAEPTPAELLELGKKVYDDWKTAGVLAGIVAMVNLMVNLTKISVIDNWIKLKKLLWIRPALAVLLGALTGVVGAVATDGNILSGVVHGMLTGSAAIGVHELIAHLKGGR